MLYFPPWAGYCRPYRFIFQCLVNVFIYFRCHISPRAGYPYSMIFQSLLYVFFFRWHISPQGQALGAGQHDISVSSKCFYLFYVFIYFRCHISPKGRPLGARQHVICIHRCHTAASQDNPLTHHSIVKTRVILISRTEGLPVWDSIMCRIMPTLSWGSLR